MSFFTPRQICAAVGGRWLCQVSDLDVPLDGVTIDSRGKVAGQAFFAIRGDRHDGHDFVEDVISRDAGVAIVERPIDVRGPMIQVADAREALGDLARVHRARLSAPIIAITGSAGKTTTKAILDSILRQTLQGVVAEKSFNNDIGVPLTLLRAKVDDEYVVLEIGMNAPGEIAVLGEIARPDIAIITMIGRGHLEGLGSIEAIAREKLSLLESVRRGGQVILGDGVDGWAGRLGRSLPSDVTQVDVGSTVPGLDNLRLAGEHNRANTRLAAAAARCLDVRDVSIAAGLAAVEPPPMRFEPVQVGEVTVVNDAYNANPESMRASIETFVQTYADAPQRVVILGDMLELGAASIALHRELGAYVAELLANGAIDAVVFVGDEMYAAHAACGGDAGHVLGCEAAASQDVWRGFAAGSAVLLKGSRGLKLERFIEHWRVMLNRNGRVARVIETKDQGDAASHASQMLIQPPSAEADSTHPLAPSLDGSGKSGFGSRGG